MLAPEADISDNFKVICPSCQELSAQDSENQCCFKSADGVEPAMTLENEPKFAPSCNLYS